MKIDNRKTFIKRLLSGTMSKEQRKIFIQLDEIDFQLRKQWDEAGNESIDWQMKEQIWRNIKNKQDNKNRRFFQMANDSCNGDPLVDHVCWIVVCQTTSRLCE